jgi:hypothetical protein
MRIALGYGSVELQKTCFGESIMVSHGDNRHHLLELRPGRDGQIQYSRLYADFLEGLLTLIEVLGLGTLVNQFFSG